MSAEPLVALEGAIAELGDLLDLVRRFTPLQEEAERDFHPAIAELGRDLRRRMRRRELDDAAVEEATRRILGLQAGWSARLGDLRTSATCEQARAALDPPGQEGLDRLLPALFADLHPVRPPRDLFFPFQPSSGRRRPGTSPFLSPAECADRLAQLRQDGLPAPAGTTWWERDFPCLEGALDGPATEAPIWLRVAAEDLPPAFTIGHTPAARIYVRRLQAPLRIGLAEEVEDEWWQAYHGSFRTFAEALRKELKRLGLPLDEDAPGEPR